jgi:hypothetical protein
LGIFNRYIISIVRVGKTIFLIEQKFPIERLKMMVPIPFWLYISAGL